MKDDGSSWLMNFICFDLTITAMELIGAVVTGSLGLSQNFIVGVCEAGLTYMNYRGRKKEATGQMRRGWLWATCSDTGVAVGFAIMAIFAYRRLADGTGEVVYGGVVLFIALVATIVNLLFAEACPKNSLNFTSAKFKMIIGAVVGAATIMNAGFILLFKGNWIDPLMTIAVSVCVVIAVIFRLRATKQPIKLSLVIPNAR